MSDVKPETAYAPPERASDAVINDQHRRLVGVEYIKAVLNAIGQVAFILNRERQIVFSNQPLLDMLGVQDVSQVLGKRPGEIVSCIHAGAKNGCGTSAACAQCGAVNAILECQRTGQTVTRECRISVTRDGLPGSLDLRTTAAAIIVGDEPFYVVSLFDISDEKRRRALERLFFHDIINTASGIEGLSSFVVQSEYDPESVRETLPIISRSSKHLLDEIVAQRELVLAESGDLKVHTEQVDARAALEETADFYRQLTVSSGKEIVIAPAGAGTFSTDPAILRRVLGNLLKNALEASAAGDTITLRATALPGGGVSFSVHNPAVMPDEVRHQVFQRSFSTKGKNRGLGTYSIRLLTQRYLGGSASFNSSKPEGTVFTISLPPVLVMPESSTALPSIPHLLK